MNAERISLSRNRSSRIGAFTLVEMLVVIVIIVVLMSMAYGGYTQVMRNARMAGSIQNMGSMISAVHTWATDHGGKLPSPEYPGDYGSGAYPSTGSTPGESNPKYWNLGESGLWLDGVVYAQIYVEEDNNSVTNLDQFAPAQTRATEGQHLYETVFEAPASPDKFRQETDWYKHSFAMNANLQFDGLFAEVGGQGDAWLTEKSLGNLPFQSNAMLFIDCMEQNVVMASDIDLIKEASERYDGRKVVVGYLDGHVEKISPDEIPAGNPESNREASRFWRGVKEE